MKVSDVTLTLFAWTDIPSKQYSRSRSTTLCAIGAMDVALWDVASKVSGLPTHRFSTDGEWRAPDVQRLKGKNLRGFNGDHR